MEAQQKGMPLDGMLFPWIPEYFEVMTEINERPFPWETYDYAKNEASTLPSDPLTENGEKIIKNQQLLSGIGKFVKPLAAGHPWCPGTEE